MMVIFKVMIVEVMMVIFKGKVKIQSTTIKPGARQTLHPARSQEEMLPRGSQA